MWLSPKPRIITALLTLLSVLFMQLAVAAFACSSPRLGNVFDLAVLPMDVNAQQHRLGCKGVHAATSALCHAHCHPDSQLLDTPTLPNDFPFVASTSTLVVSNENCVPHAISPPDINLSLARTTSPPLIIQYCHFRI